MHSGLQEQHSACRYVRTLGHAPATRLRSLAAACDRCLAESTPQILKAQSQASCLNGHCDQSPQTSKRFRIEGSGRQSTLCSVPEFLHLNGPGLPIHASSQVALANLPPLATGTCARGRRGFRDIEAVASVGWGTGLETALEYTGETQSAALRVPFGDLFRMGHTGMGLLEPAGGVNVKNAVFLVAVTRGLPQRLWAGSRSGRPPSG